MPEETVDPEAIARTHALIGPHIRRTPVIRTDGADLGLRRVDVTLKLEYLQHAGSFKARGAFANVLIRDPGEAGVVAASGGNHGAAVAFAARAVGVPATVFVPHTSSPAKVERIRGYGASLHLSGTSYADALAASRAWSRGHGALEVHAFDQHETLLGQGTLGRELSEQAPDLDTVLIAVGGGGLIAGVAAWYRSGIKVVGVEPAAAPTLTMALRAGHPVDAPAGGLAADALAPRQVGIRVFPIARDHVAEVVLVDDTAIHAAQETLWEVLRIVAEPAAATPVAALLDGVYRPEPGERIGVVISGANTTAVRFEPPPGP